MSVRLAAFAVAAAACFTEGTFLRDGRRARALAEVEQSLKLSGHSDENSAATSPEESSDGVEPTALVETGAKWRFNTNYVPQHYGSWNFKGGKWNFGADDRVQCESCGYCLYFAVDQLGDEFDASKVSKVLTEMTNDVQWVFKSACEHIVKHSKAEIVASMMKLVEPQETCRAAGYCASSPYEPMVQSGSRSLSINPVNPPVQGVLGSGTDMVTVQHPGRGFETKDGGYQMYPSPGARPISANSAMSPYTFGGYDAYGFPEASPGVPSSTPPPPATSNAGMATVAATLSNPELLSSLIPGLVSSKSAMSGGMMPPAAMGMGAMGGAAGGARGGAAGATPPV